jgi:hypothetical protein
MPWILKKREGNFEFEDLATELKTGQLNWSDLVKRVGDQEWQPLDSVVGLRRAVKLKNQPRPQTTAANASGETAAQSVRSEDKEGESITTTAASAHDRKLPEFLYRPEWVAVAVAGFALICWTWWQWRSHRRFPDPHGHDTWSFLGLGPFSLAEYLFLSVDLILACFVTARWFWRGGRQV